MGKWEGDTVRSRDGAVALEARGHRHPGWVLFRSVSKKAPTFSTDVGGENDHDSLALLFINDWYI